MAYSTEDRYHTAWQYCCLLAGQLSHCPLLLQQQQLTRGPHPRTYAPRAEGTGGSSSPPWIREIRGSAPFDAAPGSAPRRSVSRRCGRRGIPVICAASSVGADLGALFQGQGKPIRVDWTLQRKPTSSLPLGGEEREGGWEKRTKTRGGHRERKLRPAFAWGSHCGCRGGAQVREENVGE